MSVSLRADTASLDRLIDMLATDVEDAARPAAQAMAEVYYREVKRNVQALGKVTGNLERAIYQAFSKEKSAGGRAVYHVSWNERKAPHGHLVEYGHVQRYRAVLKKNGRWVTLVRPEMIGKKKPSREAAQAVKDAYYIPLPAPRQVAARPFVRPALSKAPQAIAAGEAALLRKIGAL